MARHRHICALLLLAACGCGPWESTPGFRLFGLAHEGPVHDWAFSDAFETIAVETRPWYGIPHSVTTLCFRFAGDLYVPSRNPARKVWVSHALRDDRVRLRIGEQIFERRAERVTDEATVDALFEGLRRKYSRFQNTRRGARPDLWFFRMAPR